MLSTASESSTHVPGWLGRVVAQFRIIGLLGEGGEGQVFFAEDIILKRKIALKVIPRDRDFGVAQFLNEARIIAALDHPSIVKVFEVGKLPAALFIAMEWVDGVSLAKLLSVEAQISIKRACQIGVECAEGLFHAHQKGIVHCDVKPANVLVPHAGRCRLTDFGLAYHGRQITDGREAIGAIGTPDYIAPELAKGTRPEASADQYSLAATLWHVLSGMPPFRARNRRQLLSAHIRSRLPNLSSLRSDCPRGLQQAIERALAKSPADRFETIADFAGALREFSAHRPARDAETVGRRNVSLARWALVPALAFGASASTYFLTREAGVPSAPLAVVQSVTPETAASLPNSFVAQDSAGLLSVAKMRDGLTCTVRGTLRSLQPSASGKSLKLFFDEGDSAESFYVLCYSDLFKPLDAKFGKGGLRGAVGKRIRIEGAIREFQQRPRIILRDVSQISLGSSK